MRQAPNLGSALVNGAVIFAVATVAATASGDSALAVAFGALAVGSFGTVLWFQTETGRGWKKQKERDARPPSAPVVGAVVAAAGVLTILISGLNPVSILSFALFATFLVILTRHARHD